MAPQKAGPPKIVATDYLEVSPHESWITDNAFNESGCKTDFYRIVDFFLLHSPCKFSSYTPRTLESLGWSSPWLSSRFRVEFDNVPGFIDGQNFRFQESKKQFLSEWRSYGVKWIPNPPFYEFAVFVSAGEGNPRMDLLHRIRNSLAHGRYAIKKHNKETFVFFEDVSRIQGLPGIYVLARICLKLQTLINWIALFEKKSPEAKKLSSLYSQP